MKIELAKTIDAERLSKIDQIAHDELEGWKPNSKSDFIKIIKNKKQYLIVAKNNEEILGYVSLRMDKESKWIWLEDLYVLKDWRKKGISKKLINAALKYKKNKSPKRKLVLLTADRNLEIFKKLGFNKIMNFMEYR